MYKIKRTTDGLYSKGGLNPYFTKAGKVWSTLQGLKLHLNQFLIYKGGLGKREYSITPHYPYDNCVVVEFDETTGTMTENSFSIYAYLIDKIAEWTHKEIEQNKKYQEYKEKLEELRHFKRENNIKSTDYV